VDTQSIARALTEKQLGAGSVVPASKVFGAPGMLKDRQQTALLQGAGVNPQAVRQPLEAAETLGRAAKAQPESGISEYGRAQIPLGPHGRLAILQKLPGMKKPEQKLADLQLKAIRGTATEAEHEILNQLSAYTPKDSPALPVVNSSLISALQSILGSK